MTSQYFAVPQVSPAECENCVRARRIRNRPRCWRHQRRLDEWLDLFGKRAEWNAVTTKAARTDLLLQWLRFEHSQRQRPACPSCRSEAFTRGACSICGYGVKYQPRFRYVRGKPRRKKAAG